MWWWWITHAVAGGAGGERKSGNTEGVGYRIQGTTRGLSVCLESPEGGWLLVHVPSRMKPVHLFIISVALRGIWRVSSLVLVRFV